MYLTLGQEPTTTSLPFFSMHFPFVSQHVYFAALYSNFFSLQLSEELSQTFHLPLEQLRHQEVLEELSLTILELTRLWDFLSQKTKDKVGSRLKGTQNHNSALVRKSVSLDGSQNYELSLSSSRSSQLHMARCSHPLWEEAINAKTSA